MNTAAPSPASTLYRVLSGPDRGLVVGEDDTCSCDPCDGTGEIVVETLPRSWGSPAECDARPCPGCGGIGRVYGYGLGAPTRVERVEAAAA